MTLMGVGGGPSPDGLKMIEPGLNEENMSAEEDGRSRAAERLAPPSPKTGMFPKVL